MKRITMLLCGLMTVLMIDAQGFPKVSEKAVVGDFPMVTPKSVATICTDECDYPVVGITSQMLADDIERVTGQCPAAAHHWQRPPRYGLRPDVAQ